MGKGIRRTMALMRIFISENDRYGRRPLYEAVVDLCREEGIVGATVLRGIMGYGVHGEVHSDRLLRFSEALPVVIEVIDAQERINALLPHLDEMMTGGTITLEKAEVIRYGETHV